MKHGRVDLTQVEIVRALREAGAFVQSLADLGRGVPDLLVAYHARWYVIEVKSPGGRLTPDEARWIADCRGDVRVVYSVAQALAAIGAA